MRETVPNTSTVVWPARWFRQLRLTWQRHPKERHRIETALDFAWLKKK